MILQRDDFAPLHIIPMGYERAHVVILTLSYYFIRIFITDDDFALLHNILMGLLKHEDLKIKGLNVGGQ